MAEKLGLGNEIRELKIGESFTNPKSKAFHTIRYDFWPASVDPTKKATMDVGDNHQVAVRVPHLDGAGTSQTIFKGSRRPYTKECVLLIDRKTGGVTLEKLTCNIQVKKTRSETTKLTQDKPQCIVPPISNTSNSSNNLTIRSATPPINNAGNRVSSKTRVTSGSRRADRPITRLMPKKTSPPIVSPGRPSPNSTVTSGSNHHRSPGKTQSKDSHSMNENSRNHSIGSTSTLASLPMIGIDDFTDPMPSQPHNSNNNNNSYMLSSSLPISDNNNMQNGGKSPFFNNTHHSDNENGIGTITDSSSSSSDSDSDSDSQRRPPPAPSIHMKSKVNNQDLTTLDEDLCLSESGSDSN